MQESPKFDTPRSLNTAVELVQRAADVASDVARLRWWGQAFTDLEAEFDLGDDDLPQPGQFAHELASHYLMSAGDQVKGVAVTLDPYWNLLISPAVLARSACEYLGQAWWLADPEIDLPTRVRRAAEVLRRGVAAERALMEAESVAALQELLEAVDRWVNRHTHGAKERHPGPTSLFKMMTPDGSGEQQYRHLSTLAHGGALAVVRSHHFATADPGTRTLESWWQALVTTARVLDASKRVAELKGFIPGALVELHVEHMRLSHAFDDEVPMR